jgi:hypothetical protein
VHYTTDHVTWLIIPEAVNDGHIIIDYYNNAEQRVYSIHVYEDWLSTKETMKYRDTVSDEFIRKCYLIAVAVRVTVYGTDTETFDFPEQL